MEDNKTNENIDVKEEQITDNQTEENKVVDEQTFTQADVDKRVSSAVKKTEERLRTEFENTLSEKISNQIEENKRLSKLSEKERKEEEYKNRIKELETREMKIKNRELKSDLIKILAEKNIPIEAAELIISDTDTNAEEALNKVKIFETIMEKSNENYIKSKLSDNTVIPKGGSSAEMTLEQFKKLSGEEKMKLYKENQSLFNKLESELLGTKLI